MNAMRAFESFHASVTKKWWMQLLAAVTRCLLAVGFIPPSIPKILGLPFTSMPETTVIGKFFSALLQTGYYYQFIGWSQIVAAVLLLIPRTAHLGALLFLPIIINITILTNAVGFVGTWIITDLMTVAALFLVLWEYDRLKPILLGARAGRPRRLRYGLLVIPAMFAAGGAALGAVFRAEGIGNFESYTKVGVVLAVVGLMFGFIVAMHYRFMPIGPIRDGDVSG